MIEEIKFSREQSLEITQIRFDAGGYLAAMYPLWNVSKCAFIDGHLFDGIILKVWYEFKSEEQLFRERFDSLLNKIPTKEPLHKEVEFGCCHECGQYINDWKPAFGSFAPEWWATMREHGIDPSTGHLESCRQKQIRR